MRSGPGAAARLVREVEADLVLNAIVGFAGLESTLAALEMRPDSGPGQQGEPGLRRLAGDRPGRAARDRRSCRWTPSTRPSSSWWPRPARRRSTRWSSPRPGGRSAGRDRRNWQAVTREQALAHPTWSMGEKITIDSATLMNKGLEVIEAHHLFGLPYERIEVVVHPQSLVHALVRLVDGALLAHLGHGRHARPHRVRAALPGAGLRWRCSPLDLAAGAVAGVRGARRGDVPGHPAGPGGGATGRRGDLRPQRGERGGRATPSWRESCRSWVYARWWKRSCEQSEGGDLGTYDEVVAVDEWARRQGRGACVPRCRVEEIGSS